jgi:hypothetical protein
LHSQNDNGLELQKRAVARGFTVIRTPPAQTKGVQTPDFACEKDGVRFYIEVKTPDIVGGIYAADDMANDILESRADLDGRKKPGVTFGKEVELRPHGNMDGQNATLIDALIRRICNAVKRQQLTYGPTILLVFTGRLPLDTYEPCCLVPAYFRPSPPVKSGSSAFPGECESGLWWYIGYGQPGDQILGRSDFEGKGNLAGRVANHGVLVQHSYLIGLSVMSKPWSSSAYRIHSLANSERKALPGDEQFGECDPEEAVCAISDGWNAQDNGNGIRYQMRT